VEETAAQWDAPNASYLATRGVFLGIAGGLVGGAVFGAGVLVIDALINQPLRLGMLLARMLGGGIYGAILGTPVGIIASLVVVPVLTIWLRAASVQGHSIAWGCRRARLLTTVLTALVAYGIAVAFAGSSAPIGSLLLFAVPGVLAIVYSAVAARSLVLDDPRGSQPAPSRRSRCRTRRRRFCNAPGPGVVVASGRGWAVRTRTRRTGSVDS
jgi:hypothetical protein